MTATRPVSAGLKPVSPLEFQLRQFRQHGMAGRSSRLVFTGVGGAISTLLIPLWLSASLVAIIVAWEMVTPRLVSRKPAAPASDSQVKADVTAYAVLNGIGTCLYLSLGLALWSEGSIASQMLGFAWVVGTALHVLVYFSAIRSVMLTQLIPCCIVLLVAPVLANGFGLTAGLVILSGASLMAAAGSFSIDRRKLLREMSFMESEKRAAERASADKSRFLAVMSHELRTPLNAIIGYAELVREDLSFGAGAETRDVERIESSARHLLALISQILDMSKAESAELTLETVDVDMDALLADVMDEVMPLAMKGSNRLRWRVAGQEGARLGVIATDPMRLRQCLLNLVGNACKFTKDGEIDIVARREAGTVRFEIADTGIGIPEDAQPRLFQPFVQADNGAARRYGGTGLGLAISRELARRMGGDICFTSAPGIGSRFTLSVVHSHGLAQPTGALLAA